MNVPLVCEHCLHDILPGQLYRLEQRGHHATPAPAHVACPTAREVQIAHRWRRWT